MKQIFLACGWSAEIIGSSLVCRKLEIYLSMRGAGKSIVAKKGFEILKFAMEGKIRGACTICSGNECANAI